MASFFIITFNIAKDFSALAVGGAGGGALLYIYIIIYSLEEIKVIMKKEGVKCSVLMFYVCYKKRILTRILTACIQAKKMRPKVLNI
jgi:hypothetical protein